MSDRIAFGLATLLTAAILSDLLLFQTGAMLLLARKLAAGVEYLAFWR